MCGFATTHHSLEREPTRWPGGAKARSMQGQDIAQGERCVAFPCPRARKLRQLRHAAPSLHHAPPLPTSCSKASTALNSIPNTHIQASITDPDISIDTVPEAPRFRISRVQVGCRPSPQRAWQCYASLRGAGRAGRRGAAALPPHRLGTLPPVRASRCPAKPPCVHLQPCMRPSGAVGAIGAASPLTPTRTTCPL